MLRHNFRRFSVKNYMARSVFSAVTAGAILYSAGFDPLEIGTKPIIVESGKLALYYVLYAPVIGIVAPIAGWAMSEALKDTWHTRPWDLKNGRPIGWLAELANTACNIAAGATGALAGVAGGSWLTTQFFKTTQEYFDLDKVRKLSDINMDALYSLQLGDAFANTSLKDGIDACREILSQSGSIAAEGILAGTPEGILATTTCFAAPIVGAVAGYFICKPISNIPLNIYDWATGNREPH